MNDSGQQQAWRSYLHVTMLEVLFGLWLRIVRVVAVVVAVAVDQIEDSIIENARHRHDHHR